MKKIWTRVVALAICLAMMLCGGALGEATETQTDEKDVLILFTNDVHCGIAEAWGYAGLAAVKESMKKFYDVLLVDCGDHLQGDTVGLVTKGAAVIDVMNTLGYDCAIPGNHEFDFGMDNFLELTEKANFPYICCNFTKGDELVFPAWIIKEAGGKKIGFVGVCTPTTLRSSTPELFMDENGEWLYSFMTDTTGEKMYTAVQKAVDEARDAGAEYVFVLAHLGNNAADSPFTYSDLIANTTGINAVMDGHSHDTDRAIVKNKDGEDVLRISGGTKLQNIGAVALMADGTIQDDLYHWGSDVPATTLLGLENDGADAVAQAYGALSMDIAKVIGKTTVELIVNDPNQTTADGLPIRVIRRTETNLGDFCADAYRYTGKTDIAIVHGGGIRWGRNFEPGDITYNDILTLHPFGDDFVTAEITGQQLLDAAEWSVHAMPNEFGGFEQISGFTYEVDPTIESPCVANEDGFFDHIDDSKTRRVRNLQVGGEPVDPAKTYTVSASPYHLIENGDGYTMYAGCTLLTRDGSLDYEALINYLQNGLGGVIGEEYAEPYGQGRIVSVQD